MLSLFAEWQLPGPGFGRTISPQGPPSLSPRHIRLGYCGMVGSDPKPKLPPRLRLGVSQVPLNAADCGALGPGPDAARCITKPRPCSPGNSRVAGESIVD